MLSETRTRFLADYARIRHAEGRGSSGSAYYRALPFQDLSGRNAEQWKIRARTFEYLRQHILPGTSSDILDVGAGNCWFSNRVALAGHRPVAVDFFPDSQDGLAAARHYETQFPVLEADFDHIPVRDASFDVVVYNASIHYSTDYERTLNEARRCLRPGGRVVIADSPVYSRWEHGVRMREERHQQFERQYGFRSDAIESIEFFDMESLDKLARNLRLKWEIHKPWYGLRWHLRPWKAKLAGRRPPSNFWILAGRFQ